jgi:Lrp/AsnC family leucine-responsive transcriptional regulator
MVDIQPRMASLFRAAATHAGVRRRVETRKRDMMIDEIDQEILRILQENARTSNAEIARQVGLAPSAIFQRIRKLEDQTVIEGYTARVNPRALGFHLVAFVMIKTGDLARNVDTAAILSAIPEVQEVHRVVGEDCFFVKVRVRNTEELGDLLEHHIQEIPSVASTRTTIVVKTAKDTRQVPLERNDRDDAAVA